MDVVIHNVLWIIFQIWMEYHISSLSYGLFSEECNSHLNIAKKKGLCYKTLAIHKTSLLLL